MTARSTVARTINVLMSSQCRGSTRHSHHLRGNRLVADERQNFHLREPLTLPRDQRALRHYTPICEEPTMTQESRAPIGS